MTAQQPIIREVSFGFTPVPMPEGSLPVRVDLTCGICFILNYTNKERIRISLVRGGRRDFSAIEGLPNDQWFQHTLLDWVASAEKNPLEALLIASELSLRIENYRQSYIIKNSEPRQEPVLFRKTRLNRRLRVEYARAQDALLSDQVIG